METKKIKTWYLMAWAVIFIMFVTTTTHAENSIGEYQWDRISIPYNIAEPAVVVYQENVYLIGGSTEMSHNSHCSNQIWKFDPKASTWQEMGGQLPYGMYTRGNVVVSDNKLIISPSEGPSLAWGYGSHKNIVEYDFITDLAVEVETAAYPNVVWGVNFGSFNINGEDRVYSFGGWNSSPVNGIYSYQVNSGSLQLIETASLNGNGSVPLVGYDSSGKAYLFGGNSPKLTVDVFDPVTETISHLGNILPQEILGEDSFAWTASTGEIFIAKPRPSQKIYIFNPLDNTFTEASFSLPTPTDGYYLNHGAYNYTTGSIYVVESKTWDGTNQFDSHIWIGTPVLKLSNPNGGEELIAGNTKTITWEIADYAETDNVKIEYSSNNGSTWNEIDPNTPNVGEYEWTVPKVTSDQCLVRISDVGDPSISDTNDEVFTIYECRRDIPADIDNNCHVDLMDFVLLAQDWLECGNPFDSTCNAFTEEAFIPASSVGTGIMRGIELSPDESSLFVTYWADTSADPVEEYSLTDYGMINTMSYGRCHDDVGVSSNGRYVFISSYYQSNVSRFDLQNSNQRTDLSANYSWAAKVATTPDRQKLVALGGRDGRSYNMNNDGISIYDISGDNFSLLAPVDLPDEPANMAFSLDGNYVYVLTNPRISSQPMIYEISIDGTYQITRSIAINSSRLDSVAIVGDDLYITDYTNSKLLTVDITGDFTSVKATYDLESAPGNIKLHPNGRDLYILMPNDNRLVVWDTFTKSVYNQYDQLNDYPEDIAFCSDGRVFILSISAPNRGIQVLRN